MWIAPERRSLSRWIVPGVVLAAGVVVAAVLAADGRRETGLVALAVLAGYAGHLGYRRHGKRCRSARRSATATGPART